MSHARLSPSSSSRWLNCPGSMNLIDSYPSKPEGPNPHAAEGTAAHEVAELCLLNDTDTTNEYLQAYLDYVRSHVQPGGQMRVEVRCSLKHFDIPGLDGGTADALIINPKDRSLEVIDLKYGRGIVVEPENNTQMMQYALGALYEVDLSKYDTITMTIVQPRAFHPDGIVRSHTMTVAALMNWCNNTLIPGAELTGTPDAPLVPGDAQCRWCPAAKVCPALHQRTQEVAQVEFADMTEHTQLPSCHALTPEQLKRVLDNADVIRKFLDEVEVHARYLVDQGETVEGYKLVRRITRRKLVEDADDLLWGYLEEEEIYDKKVKSLANLEKELKQMHPDTYKDLVKSITFKPEGETVLAKSTDRRKEVQPSVTSDFEGVE